jgi:DNA-binding beta-propeller fold protein YncE
LFIGSTTATVGSLIGLIYIFQDLPLKAFRHLLRFAVLGILFLLTARTAFRASYMNADLANEYLVYAHSAPGVKTVLSQIEEFSRRTTGGLSVQVAFDNDVSWPYTWYFRNYSNTHYYAENPTRELLEYPLIIAGNDNWTEVERIIGNRYISSEFIRMWWPNQDYFKMSVASIDAERRSEILLETGDEPAPIGAFEYIRRVLEHISPFFTDPQARKAVWQIWLNRDFSYYGEINDRDFSLENWSPSDSMRFYVRRDVAEQLWDYGFLAGGVSDLPAGDPYLDRIMELQSELIVDTIDAEPMGLLSPRGVATAADGSVYVADSQNHRIVHLSVQGTLLNQWGSFGQMQDGVPAVPGTFSEPWGVAVDPDGNVFVADTWNHRVQKFSADGEFISMIGPSAEGDEQIFWGPRALAFDREGRLFIADTGNHRIAIYDNTGEFLGDFGEQGYDFGQLREPVGIAFDSDNRIYVVDTWNHRVQVFEEIGENEFFFMKEWTVEGWYGESLENKPYIAISSDDNICLTDPEGFRVLCFSQEGSYTIGWGDYGATDSRFGLLSGVGFTEDGKIWVSDPGNNRVMLFEPPLP